MEGNSPACANGNSLLVEISAIRAAGLTRAARQEPIRDVRFIAAYQPPVRQSAMAQRADEFRKAAAQCLALAGKARDPSTRAMLLLLAQKWHEHADNPAADIRFDAILKEFNDQQMSKL